MHRRRLRRRRSVEAGRRQHGDADARRRHHDAERAPDHRPARSRSARTSNAGAALDVSRRRDVGAQRTSSIPRSRSMRTSFCIRPSRRAISIGVKQNTLARHPAGEGRSRSRWALRVLPLLLYGAGHAYAQAADAAAEPRRRSRRSPAPISSSSIATWFKPNHATLVVVGDTTMAEITPEARAAFARLEAGRRADEEDRARRRAGARRCTCSTARAREQSCVLAGDAGRRPRPTRTRPPIETVQRRVRRRVRLAHQHEPARGQALVVRRVQLLRRRARAAAVHGLAPVQTDKTEGVAGRSREGAARSPSPTSR